MHVYPWARLVEKKNTISPTLALRRHLDSFGFRNLELNMIRSIFLSHLRLMDMLGAKFRVKSTSEERRLAAKHQPIIANRTAMSVVDA